MKGLVFGSVGNVELAVNLPKPTPREGEVLVRVRAAGVCAADLYTFEGRNPYVSYPRVGGHEVSGIVEGYGPSTSGPPPGTRVVVEPFISCGVCYPCRIGKGNCCRNLQIMGIHFDGGFADYLVSPVDRLHLIPDHLDFQSASFAEPVAIGVQAVRRADIAENEDVLVLGAGPIGLAIAEVARERGANVFVTDINAKRLNTVQSYGATPVPSGDDLVARILDLTDGDGMPVVIEATGNSKVVESTIDLVAAGGRIVIVGVVKQGIDVAIPGLDFTRKEVTILGSRASVDCFPESIELIATGRLKYPEIASGFTLDAGPDVFNRMSAGDDALHKAVFLID
jgi:L-gulonate 5-dehydrogenase